MCENHEESTFQCDHCGEFLDENMQVDIEREHDIKEFHENREICRDCFDELDTEFSGHPSWLSDDESEEDFWEHENEDGLFGSPD